MIPVLVTVLAVIIVVYFYGYKPHQHWKKFKVPYTTPLPFFGHMVQFLIQTKTLQDTIQDLYNATQARVTGIYFFNAPILMIRDLSLIKKVGIKDFDHFVDHRPVSSPDIDPLFGKNLFTLRGNNERNTNAYESSTPEDSDISDIFIELS